MDEKVYIGIVTYYSPEKHFGFIDSEVREGIYFYFNVGQAKKLPSCERKQIRFTFLKGDEVSYSLRTTEKGQEAFDLKFLRNEKAEQMLMLLNENEMLPGYLKKINDKYYVKDIVTYLFLPLTISKWEVDLKEVYELRVNQLVYYSTPENSERIEKVKVSLTDRRWSKLYRNLKEYQINTIAIPATITGKNKKGYFVTIMNGQISSFLPFRKQNIMPEFRKWQNIEVIVKSLYEDKVQIELYQSAV